MIFSGAVTNELNAMTKEDASVSKKILTKMGGEITVAKSTCLTNIVSISEYVRPLFTDDFITALERLNNATEYTKKDEFIRFVKEFGTHYAKKTVMGAQLIYERRFATRKKGNLDKKSRNKCVKEESRREINAKLFLSVNEESQKGEEKCTPNEDDQRFENSNSAELTRIITIGSRPKQFGQWVGECR